MEAAVACVRPAAKAALVVGMGAGTLPHYLLARGIVTDVVEQSSVVVDMAERHFRFARGGQNRSDGATTLVANAESARAFVCAGGHATTGELPSSRRQYDVVFASLDALPGFAAPPPSPSSSSAATLSSVALSSATARCLKQQLLPGGVLVLVATGFHRGPLSRQPRRLLAALRGAFAEARAFRDEDPAQELQVT